MFDAAFGYKIWQPIAFSLGVSWFQGSGGASSTAAIPSPIFVGVPTITTFGPEAYGDLGQSNVAINFQVMLIAPLSDRWELTVFGGPSVIRVSQDIGSATAALNPAVTIDSESGTTGKAGSGGADLTYRLNDRYGLGFFVRYLGGEVDLPTVPNLQVGGLQAGAGIRIPF
jgi:hypothetical protein